MADKLKVHILISLSPPLVERFGDHPVGSEPELTVAAACALVEMGFARIVH
jgi:hypothetical protein